MVEDMRMADLKPQFSYLVEQIARRHTDFAYIHVVEPRVSGFTNREPQPGEVRAFHVLPLPLR